MGQYSGSSKLVFHSEHSIRLRKEEGQEMNGYQSQLGSSEGLVELTMECAIGRASVERHNGAIFKCS